MSDVGFDEAWVTGFVELQIKALHGDPLTHEERRFLAGIELAEHALPGAVAEALLRRGLGARTAGDALGRVAAAGPGESELYRRVQQAVREEQTSLVLELDDGPLPVLEILAAEEMVAPCYREGYTTIIERKSFERQVVGKYGGIFIALNDLKRMELEYDAGTRTIRLHEK